MTAREHDAAVQIGMVVLAWAEQQQRTFEVFEASVRHALGDAAPPRSPAPTGQGEAGREALIHDAALIISNDGVPMADEIDAARDLVDAGWSPAPQPAQAVPADAEYVRGFQVGWASRAGQAGDGEVEYTLRHPTGAVEDVETATIPGPTTDLGEAWSRLEVADSDCLCRVGESDEPHVLLTRTIHTTAWTALSAQPAPEPEGAPVQSALGGAAPGWRPAEPEPEVTPEPGQDRVEESSGCPHCEAVGQWEQIGSRFESPYLCRSCGGTYTANECLDMTRKVTAWVRYARVEPVTFDPEGGDFEYVSARDARGILGAVDRPVRDAQPVGGDVTEEPEVGAVKREDDSDLPPGPGQAGFDYATFEDAVHRKHGIGKYAPANPTDHDTEPFSVALVAAWLASQIKADGPDAADLRSHLMGDWEVTDVTTDLVSELERKVTAWLEAIRVGAVPGIGPVTR